MHLFFKGYPLRSVGALIFPQVPLFFHSFCFHNSGIRPPPFFSLLLTTMPHGRRSVTTSLDCVGTPAVAVLCESDWPSSACVVQLERKKKKRVSVIVGNRKVLKKASNHHQLPSNHHKVPSNHHKAPSNHHKVIINWHPTINNRLPMIKNRLLTIITCSTIASSTV